MIAHLDRFYLVPGNALMPASLDVQPMRSCPKLSNNTPEMLVAAILDVRLAAVSHLMSLYTSVLLEGSGRSCAT